MASLSWRLALKTLTEIVNGVKPRTPGLAAPDQIRRRVKVPHGVCRLTLDINGTAYAVIPNRGASELVFRSFRLKKSDGTIYDVAMTAHGHTCDCPDYLFNRQDKDVAGCKHVKAMKACGLL
jgi:hypothetical protein